MSQRDIVLNIPMCSFQEIMECEDPISRAKEFRPNTFEPVLVLDKEGNTRPRHICESAVPAACPRIQCYSQTFQTHLACRMQVLIQSEKNESGFWMKLPCSQCEETRQLHPTTEGFVHGEDAGRS